jgi:hypothetical protein
MPVIDRFVRAPSSVLLIMDPVVGQVPETMGGRLVASTPSCVAIGTLSEADGLTKVRVVASANLPEHNAPPTEAWQGVLATPSRELVMSSVTEQRYAGWPVGESTRLRLLVNDDNEPDEIWVVVE